MSNEWQLLNGRIDSDRIILPENPGYAEATRVWNGAVDARPAVVVRAASTGDVRNAVLAAREAGLPITVRGGGHDWAGRAMRSGALTVDLSGLRQVTVDEKARTAVVGGGATAADLVAAAAPYGLITPTGTSAGVGMVGLAGGGGYGPLTAAHGLTLDNVLAAQVVLADGRVVDTDADHEPDLLWAIRGGGGNFGVITSMRFRLHPFTTALSGFMIFGPHQAAQVWHGLEQILAGAPDDLSVDTGFITSPDGSPAVLVSPTWVGDEATGQDYMGRLSALGQVFASRIAPVPYEALIGFVDTIAPAGRHYALRTRNLPGFTDEIVATLIAAGRRRTSPFSTIPLHSFRGAAARVAPDATAFTPRTPHFMTEIIGSWEPGDGDTNKHRQWVEETAEALDAYALPGGYVNLLGPDETARAAGAFGGNTARLLAAKRRYDPDDVFTAVTLPA